MKQTRTSITGTYHDALEIWANKGGMLFPPKNPDSATTIVCGKQTLTIWPPDSPLRANIQAFARELGFTGDDITNATATSITNHLLDNIIQLPYRGTRWDRKFRELAKDSWHWHYLYCKEGSYRIAFEIDLKSAYLTSFLNNPSLLYSYEDGFLDDKGARDNLAAIADILPKWYRLILLGKIASYQMKYYVWDIKDGHRRKKLCTINKISHGAAFNAVHKAVLRVWRTMKQCHEIAGNSAIRLHTDSITINYDENFSTDKEYALIDWIKEAGFDYSIKGGGQCNIFDLNTGFIGSKIFGHKPDVIRFCEERKVRLALDKPCRNMIPYTIKNSSKINGGIFDETA